MVERECPVCGATYEADATRLKHGRQTTCSRQCSYSLRAKKKSTSVTGPCGVCGAPVTRPPSKVARAKTPALLCSPECAYTARSTGLVGREVSGPYDVPEKTRKAQAGRMRAVNVRRKAEGRYAHTEETKRKLSEATTRAIAEGRIPRVSKIERRIGPILDKLGITFDAQHKVRGANGRFVAVVDYFLPDLDIALEFNGTFWHADPRVYPNGPEYPSQQRTATKYAEKLRHLTDRNILVVEVWEMDFEADPEHAVRTALISGSWCIWAARCKSPSASRTTG